MSNKSIFNWSGGKDSALALYKILQNDDYHIGCLLTSVNKEYQRISMHGIRKELLIQQAQSIGLPLEIIEIPESTNMDTYDRLMLKKLSTLKKSDYEYSIFGDIFLEDLRAYREQKLAEAKLKAVFPLWKIDTKEVIQEFIDLGFKISTHQRIRFEGINTPETYSVKHDSDEYKKGLAAKNFVIQRIGENNYDVIIATNRDTGKYGRYIGTIWLADSETSLNDELVEKGFAEVAHY